MMTLSLYSQQLLTDSSAIVPVRTLKNALIMKAERDYLKFQISLTRDSVTTYQLINSKQDKVINTLENQIIVYNKNEDHYKGIISSKDKIINEKNNQITDLKKKVVKLYATTGLVSIIGVFLIVLL